MPHNTFSTPSDTDHGWGWITTTDPIPLHADTSDQSAVETGSEWGWIDHSVPHESRPTTPVLRRRLGKQVRVWVIATVVMTIAGVATAAMLTTHHSHHSAAAAPARGTANSSAAPPVPAACTGLSGATVTDRAGPIDTVPGLIATFENDYYTARSADHAMRTLAADSGITAPSLAAGIAQIPAGSTHCVAINPITRDTAAVHLVELHPDHSRTDYLQLINTRRTPAGLLISNIQKQQ